jgi:hypothetical protein
MILWLLFLGISLFALADLSRDLPVVLRKNQGGEILSAESLFFELEETLGAGLLPGEERWAKLESLSEPWRTLSVESLRTLRSEGGSVVPTLRRFRELARRHFNTLSEARAKSAQAIAQAFVCALLIPVFGFALRFLLPEVEEAGGVWWFGTATASLLGLLAGLWIWKMAEEARWGGLRGGEREWMLGTLVFGERILALLRLGRAPDRAWVDSLAMLPAPLRSHWGGDAWKAEGRAADPVPAKSLREALLGAGNAFRKSIQSSLWEGYPCSERIESAIAGLRTEIRAYQERELQLLGTRALKPLFLLTAPGLLGLLGFALLLSFGGAFE